MVGVGENDLLAWELRGADKRRSEKQRAREDKRKKKPAGRGLGDDSWFHAAVGRVGPVASFQVGPFVVCVLLDCCS